MDPFQETSFSAIEGFWFVYRETATNSLETNRLPLSCKAFQTVKRVPADFVLRVAASKAFAFAQKLSRLQIPELTLTTKLTALETVKDVLNYHTLVLNSYFSSIPMIRWFKLSEDTKQKVLTAALSEVPLIRYASRHFNQADGNRDLSWNIAATKELLAACCISPSLIGRIVDMMLMFSQLRLDQFETALVVVICAVSPDHGLRNQSDYRMLSIVQEFAMQMLQLKLSSKKTSRTKLPDIISFLSELRNFAAVAETEWQKFALHKDKVFLRGRYKESKDRIGINYLCQFKSR